jgi:hypothetical protein
MPASWLVGLVVKWTISGVPGTLEEVARQGAFMTVNAHFDGRVIVPDEPLDLKPNQALIVQIELIEGETEEPALAWIAANAVDSDALPTDLADQHDRYLDGRPKNNPRR